MALMNKLNYAPAAFKALNGVFCIYKPADMTVAHAAVLIKKSLVNDLNAMPDRPLRERVVIDETKVDTDGLPVVTTVPDLADHPLVVGPRYQIEDFHIGYSNWLHKDSSGVIAMGINSDKKKALLMKYAGYMRVYHVEGILGRCTQNYSPDGRLIERTTWKHVTQGRMEKCLSAAQASHQRMMYHYMGIELDSQEAYEVAAKGVVRPQESVNEGPVIYGIKLFNFNPPNFTIEVHTIGERCLHLKQLIHNLALDMKSSAVCNLVRRVRYGNFTLEHALLRQQWNVENIIGSIQYCKSLVTKDKLKTGLQMKELEMPERLLLPDGFVEDDNANDYQTDVQRYLPDGT